MVTCRPEISFHVVKLSQYATQPSQIHFEAVKHLYLYLKATLDDGIYYWRKDPRPDLQNAPLPLPRSDTNYNHNIPVKQNYTGTTLTTAADSEHASDTTHRKSVSGIIHILAGGCIHS